MILYTMAESLSIAGTYVPTTPPSRYVVVVCVEVFARYARSPAARLRHASPRRSRTLRVSNHTYI